MAMIKISMLFSFLETGHYGSYFKLLRLSDFGSVTSAIQARLDGEGLIEQPTDNQLETGWQSMICYLLIRVAASKAMLLSRQASSG